MKQISNKSREITLLILFLILILNVGDFIEIKSINLINLNSFFITLVVTLIIFEIIEIISRFDPHLKVKDMMALLISLIIIVLILHNLFEPQQNQDFLKTIVFIIILIIHSTIFFKNSPL